MTALTKRLCLRFRERYARVYVINLSIFLTVKSGLFIVTFKMHERTQRKTI